MPAPFIWGYDTTAHRMSRHAFVLVAAAALWAQAPPMPSDPPRGYVCYRTDTPPSIDGRLDEAAWQRAPWTDDFIDIEGDRQPKPALRTRVKMLWDDRYFYIGADLVEPNLWATLRQHDSVIFHDNDFEFFIDPNGDNHEYYEFEMNALNTTWDLLLTRPYRDEGKAVNNWEIAGLKSAVHLDGTLNDPSDVDRGWTIEIAVPWFALGEQAHRPAPPHAGDQWRMNFTRVETPLSVEGGAYRKKDGPSRVFSWARQYVFDIHRPETWGYVQFETTAISFMPDPAWPARRWLKTVYEAQREYQRAHGRYAASLDELDIALPTGDSLRTTRTGATGDLWESCVATGNDEWCIRQDSRLWKK